MTTTPEVADSTATRTVWLVARVAAFAGAALLVPPVSLVALILGWVLMMEGPLRKGVALTAVVSAPVVALNIWLYLTPFG